MKGSLPTTLEQSALLSVAEINGICSKLCYYIAEYQRGYRWTKINIDQLLKDINENKIGKSYCLQPIMVVPITNKEGYNFEVIDGQQRITTIYIILKVLIKHNVISDLLFDIDYATRKSCISFLKNITDFDFTENESEILLSWDKITESEKNIDNYHLFNAYQEINLWLSKMNIPERQIFAKKVINDVKLIWYPVKISESSNAKKLFRNINSGKIKLTSADLIKALFVLDLQNTSEPTQIKNQRKTEFANNWHDMEKKMNDDAFWFFINSDKNDDYITRLGLLFDIITKSHNEKIENEAYLCYQNNTTSRNWDQVVDLFQKIDEWFSNEKYYHRIGFLVNSKLIKFHEIIDEYLSLFEKKKKKSDFYNFLELKIKSYVDPTKLSELNYKKNPKECQNVLLFYNILIYEKEFPAQKFPFDLFVNEEWSLEHIHPQNPQEWKKLEDVQLWLKDSLRMISSKSADDSKENNLEILPISEKIEQFISDINNKIIVEYNRAAKEKVKEIKELLESESKVHGLGNLVLLDKSTNSKLKNGLFRDKREIILKLGKYSTMNNYVPYGSINCFLKRHTKKSSLQNQFWSESDGDEYFKNITDLIK